MIYNEDMDAELSHIEVMHTIAHMYCRGYSVYDISKMTGKSIAAITKELDNIRTLWRDSAVFDFNERISYELKKLDYLETMYWESWEKSKREAELSFSEVEIDSDEEGPKRKRSKRTTSLPPGDPRFLEGVRWCIERRCQLLGLDAPKKSAVFTANVDMAPVVDELESSKRQQELIGLIKSLSQNAQQKPADEDDIIDAETIDEDAPED